MLTEERQVKVLTCGGNGGGKGKIHGETNGGALEASLSDVHRLEKEESITSSVCFFEHSDTDHCMRHCISSYITAADFYFTA